MSNFVPQYMKKRITSKAQFILHFTVPTHSRYQRGLYLKNGSEEDINGLLTAVYLVASGKIPIHRTQHEAFQRSGHLPTVYKLIISTEKAYLTLLNKKKADKISFLQRIGNSLPKLLYLLAHKRA